MKCDGIIFFSLVNVICVDFAHFARVSPRNYFYQFDSLVSRGTGKGVPRPGECDNEAPGQNNRIKGESQRHLFRRRQRRLERCAEKQRSRGLLV